MHQTVSTLRKLIDKNGAFPKLFLLIITNLLSSKSTTGGGTSFRALYPNSNFATPHPPHCLPFYTIILTYFLAESFLNLLKYNTLAITHHLQLYGISNFGRNMA